MQIQDMPINRPKTTINSSNSDLSFRWNDKNAKFKMKNAK